MDKSYATHTLILRKKKEQIKKVMRIPFSHSERKEEFEYADTNLCSEEFRNKLESYAI